MHPVRVDSEESALPATAPQATSTGTARIMKTTFGATTAAFLLFVSLAARPVNAAAQFNGRFFTGEGDVEYLQLLDVARRMYDADYEFQNMAMLYTAQWNGLVEGPTWGAWWVQNSYGPTYCAIPFYEEPFVTFLQNSQDLWFNKMGDGKTSYVWNGKDSWVPPDGCLMDCASDTWAMHRQGHGVHCGRRADAIRAAPGQPRAGRPGKIPAEAGALRQLH
jgi:hypothetical protein